MYEENNVPKAVKKTEKQGDFKHVRSLGILGNNVIVILSNLK